MWNIRFFPIVIGSEIPVGGGGLCGVYSFIYSFCINLVLWWKFSQFWLVVWDAIIDEFFGIYYDNITLFNAGIHFSVHEGYMNRNQINYLLEKTCNSLDTNLGIDCLFQS